MGFKELQSLDADITITLGGVDKKTKKTNPKQIEGYYLGKRQVKGGKFTKPGKLDSIYYFQTSTGNVAVWGKTDLDRKMQSAPPGAMLRATHVGMTPTPNGDMHKYKVEVDEDNIIDVSGFATPEPTNNVLTADFDDSNEVDGEQDEEEKVEYEPQKTIAPTRVSASRAEVEAILNGKRAKS